MRRPPLPQLLLYVLGGTLLLALVIAASTSAASFGAYNSAWDGTAEVRDIAATYSESTVTLDGDAYTTEEPTQTLAVVLAPTAPYGSEDAGAVRRFVENGGTLLVADNFGPTEGTPPHGNALLSDVGATARLDGALLRDERNYYRSPALPVAQPVEEHPYTSGATDLTLNYGTAVTPNDATTLVRTSEFAYLDTDRSGSLDDDENLSRYPVVTIESVGDGQVITVGDPSIFINAMLDRNGNTAFATALMQAHEQVIFDYSQSDSQPPLAVALLIFRETLLLQMLVGVVGVGLSWRVLTKPASLSRLRNQVAAVLPGLNDQDTIEGHERDAHSPTLTEAELLAYLREEHPEWEEDRLRRILAGVIEEEPATTDNE